MSTIYVFQHNFWPGFVDGTDPVSLPFFLNLLSRVFDKEVLHTDDIQKATILLESIGFHGEGSVVQYKNWDYKILFSGESRLCVDYHLYDCILWGIKTNIQNKTVCCPLCIPYMCSSNAIQKIIQMDNTPKTEIPPYKKILAVISNPAGEVRNYLLNILEQYFTIDYAGNYRLNRPRITENYYSEEFWKEASKYRCIIAMENSCMTDYLTEKITHGFASGNVPIYWGADNVNTYFNEKRFIQMKDLNSENVYKFIDQVSAIMNDDNNYLEMVNSPIFANGESGESFIQNQIDRIVYDIKLILNI